MRCNKCMHGYTSAKLRYEGLHCCFATHNLWYTKCVYSYSFMKLTGILLVSSLAHLNEEFCVRPYI